MTSQGWRLPVILAIIGLVGTISTAMIANWDVIFPPNPTTPAASTTPGHSTDPTTPQPTTAPGRAAVQNVYNLPEARGLDIIRKQGFTSVRVMRVCSNSVSAGRIREVLLDNNAPVSDETALVNQYGSTGIEVAFATKLAVKVSTGQGCS